MHVKCFRVTNFRRLKDALVDLNPNASVLVGANNSGKTSATHVFQLFLGEAKGRFSVYDFTADTWDLFDKFGDGVQGVDATLPEIALDVWFEVDEPNLHRVVDLLPDLDWSGSPVGMRLAYCPKDSQSLLNNYREARAKASEFAGENSTYKPWPRSLTDYLQKRLGSEYEIRYSILDRNEFDDYLQPLDGCSPHDLGNATTGAARLIESLIRVDFLDAQRYLADGESRGRYEDLSRRLSRYYARNLRQHDDDIEALTVLADSEARLNAHFAEVFEPVLGSLEELGYPGVANHQLVVKAEFNPATILNGNAYVHYALSRDVDSAADGPTLPDRYNGLGFKNLIYMAVEILDFHHAWAASDGERPPVHLVMVEEPESHLHAQLQQVFIRKMMDILPDDDEEFQTQLVVTTHSSHIIYESSFQNIRYFKRHATDSVHTSEVKNLSMFYDKEEKATRDFLLQYLKLTHCDLFFADAAILVEGNVERLLLPLAIGKECPTLQSCHLTILEVGGAFAHKFDKLIAFLDLPTLVITDLDSVESSPDSSGDEGELLDSDDTSGANGKKCRADTLGAVTSNETIIQWAPKLTSVAELLAAPDHKKLAIDENGRRRSVRVAYQTAQPVSWRGDATIAAGRTLEEAFALENLSWSQDLARQHLGLRIGRGDELDLDELRDRLYKRVANLDKTKFALGLIAFPVSDWVTPAYIVDGLRWLTQVLVAQDPAIVCSPEPSLASAGIPR